MEGDRTHRRDFVRAVALGGGAAALADPRASRADDEPKAEEAPRSEVDARMELILARYGDQLDDEAREAVRKDVESVVRRGEALRAFALDNGDAPFPVFRPYREALSRTGADGR